MIGGLRGLAVGASVLNIASPVIPEGLLPPAGVIPFDRRVGAFCLAIASVLLFGAGLLLRALLAVEGVDRGIGRRAC